MKTKFNISLACGAAILLMSAGLAQADNKTFSIGGDIEVNLDWKDLSDSGSSIKHGGRVKLNAVGEGTGANGYFIKGVAQPLIPLTGDDVGFDDVFLQIGQKDNWDTRIGRFEGMDVLPAGKDTVLENAAGVDVYRANALRGRKNDMIHAAVNVYPMPGVNLELGTMIDSDGSGDYTGFRPAISYSNGPMTIRAAYEHENDKSSNKTNGFGGSVGYNFGMGEVNFGAATNDNDVMTANLSYTQGPWGVGYLHSREDVEGAPNPQIDSFYGAYTVPLMGIKDASMTIGASTSKAKNVGAPDDTVNAVRVRFNYGF